MKLNTTFLEFLSSVKTSVNGDHLLVGVSKRVRLPSSYQPKDLEVIDSKVAVARKGDLTTTWNEFYAASPGHKSVEELTMYRVSINSADLSNEELKSYIIKRIEQQEQVRGGYIGGKGGEGAARVSENNTIQLVGVCNGCTIGELLQMVENHNSSRSNKSYLVINCDDCTIEDVLQMVENHNSSRSNKSYLVINCDGCNINEGTYGVVGEQAIEVIKATTKAKKESSNEDAAAQREGYIGGKGGEGKIESGDMTQPRPKVPGWIKNNAEWFAQGVISEDDFVKGLEWMINNGIIRAEHAAGGVK